MVKKFGTRSEVVDGLAQSTRGGLTADDLIINRAGKIVSKKKSMLAKQTYAQYGFKKREAEAEAEEAEPDKQPEKKKRRRRKKNVAAQAD